MPELPEVETITQELSKQLLNKTITKINILNPKLRYPIPQDILELTFTIRSVSRKAKYIIITLNENNAIIIHLGMTGKILIQDKNYQSNKHDHVTIELDNKTTLVYNDTRKFGFIALKNSLPPSFYTDAPDPLALDFSTEKLKTKLRASKAPIKACIMNNKIITGVGNIYANEALFKAKILPICPANQLSNKKLDELIKQIIITLKAAIKAGGSSIKDYRNSSGNLGYFQQQLLVYNKEGKPCVICKNKIKRIIQSGRSSFFCSTCQK